MNTYPEMNKQIVGLLRISDNPVDLYAAQYIEELQKRVPKRPHGRLIDVKSLENMHFTESMYDAEGKLFVPFVEVASAIIDAPTIIPASEGGE